MKNLYRTILFSIMFTGLIIISGCGRANDDDEMAADTTSMGTETPQMQSATATLQPAEGNQAQGTLTFTQLTDTSLQITGQISGLSAGMHGIHIHENGVCEGDFTSAGGHFNPTGAKHGGPPMGGSMGGSMASDTTGGATAQRHAGDLGNIEADANGSANIDIVDNMLSMSGMNAIVGKAIVVHSGQDDLKTDPAGNSGSRIACGVIQMQGSGMGNDPTMTDTTSTAPTM